MTALQLWIYEDDRPVALHSTLSMREATAGLAGGRDVLAQAMDHAVRDVEAGRFCLDAEPARAAAEQESVMVSRRRRKSDAQHTDEKKLDEALEDSFPASDPVSFIEPAPKEPKDTPLDKARGRSR